MLYPASGTDARGRPRVELRSPRKLPSLLLSPFRPLSQRLLRGFEQLSLDRCVAQIRKSTRRKLTPWNHIRPSAFKTWLPWLRAPIPLTPIGVVGAISSLSDIGHEDREVCGSQRGARSLNDFCGERDGHYADRVFDFANSVLTAHSNSKRRMARTAMLAGFSMATSLRACPCSNPPRSSWFSISKPLKPSAAPSRSRYSTAPTR